LWTESYIDGLGREYLSVRKGADSRGDVYIRTRTIDQTLLDPSGNIIPRVASAQTSIPYFASSRFAPEPPSNLWAVKDLDALQRETMVRAPHYAGVCPPSGVGLSCLETRTSFTPGRR